MPGWFERRAGAHASREAVAAVAAALRHANPADVQSTLRSQAVESIAHLSLNPSHASYGEAVREQELRLLAEVGSRNTPDSRPDARSHSSAPRSIRVGVSGGGRAPQWPSDEAAGWRYNALCLAMQRSRSTRSVLVSFILGLVGVDSEAGVVGTPARPLPRSTKPPLLHAVTALEGEQDQLAVVAALVAHDATDQRGKRISRRVAESSSSPGVRALLTAASEHESSRDALKALMLESPLLFAEAPDFVFFEQLPAVADLLPAGFNFAQLRRAAQNPVMRARAMTPLNKQQRDYEASLRRAKLSRESLYASRQSDSHSDSDDGAAGAMGADRAALADAGRSLLVSALEGGGQGGHVAPGTLLAAEIDKLARASDTKSAGAAIEVLLRFVRDGRTRGVADVQARIASAARSCCAAVGNAQWHAHGLDKRTLELLRLCDGTRSPEPAASAPEPAPKRPMPVVSRAVTAAAAMAGRRRSALAAAMAAPSEPPAAVDDKVSIPEPAPTEIVEPCATEEVTAVAAPTASVDDAPIEVDAGPTAFDKVLDKLLAAHSAVRAAAALTRLRELSGDGAAPPAARSRVVEAARRCRRAVGEVQWMRAGCPELLAAVLERLPQPAEVWREQRLDDGTCYYLNVRTGEATEALPGADGDAVVVVPHDGDESSELASPAMMQSDGGSSASAAHGGAQDAHAAAPAQWQAVWSDEHGCYYYYDAATGVSTWEAPA